jgi:hypothetical protein
VNGDQKANLFFVLIVIFGAVAYHLVDVLGTVLQTCPVK